MFVGEFGQGLVDAETEDTGRLPEPAGRLGSGGLLGGGGLSQDLGPVAAFLARISSRFFSFSRCTAAIRASRTRRSRSSSSKWAVSAVMYGGAVHTVVRERCG